mgnify:CR=1 FL=1
MRIYDANDNELMQVREIGCEDGKVVIRGKIFGAMPMVAKLTPKEARVGLRLLGFRTILKLIPFLLKR